MKVWKIECCNIYEDFFEDSVHCFKFYKNDKLIGASYPDSDESMNDIMTELDNGACPLCDWGDGVCRGCLTNPWGLL